MYSFYSRKFVCWQHFCLFLNNESCRRRQGNCIRIMNWNVVCEYRSFNNRRCKLALKSGYHKIDEIGWLGYLSNLDTCFFYAMQSILTLLTSPYPTCIGKLCDLYIPIITIMTILSLIALKFWICHVFILWNFFLLDKRLCFADCSLAIIYFAQALYSHEIVTFKGLMIEIMCTAAGPIQGQLRWQSHLLKAFRLNVISYLFKFNNCSCIFY